MKCVNCNTTFTRAVNFCSKCGFDQRVVLDQVSDFIKKDETPVEDIVEVKDNLDLEVEEVDLVEETLDVEDEQDEDLEVEKVVEVTPPEVVVENKVVETTPFDDGKPKRSRLNMGIFDYIALEIGVFLIGVFTLGIGVPIAATIRAKFINDRRILSNRKVTFNGTAGDLYITYIKWIILVIVTLGIYGFWIERNMLRWEAENTSFADKTSTEGKSFFDGTAGKLFVVNLLSVLMVLLTLGIAAPWATAYKSRYVNTHTVINGHRLQFTGTGGALFGNYIKWVLLSLITFGIYGIYIGLNLLKWGAEHTLVSSNISTQIKLTEQSSKINKLDTIALGLIGANFVLYVIVDFLAQGMIGGYKSIFGVLFIFTIFLLPLLISIYVIIINILYFKQKDIRFKTVAPFIVAIIVFLSNLLFFLLAFSNF